MRILITGASGYLGTMLRQLLANHELSLLSRKPVALGRREECFVSRNLWDKEWWNAIDSSRQFDAIFHLAEAVKQRLGDSTLHNVIDGHVDFITHFTDRGAKVVYPLTAYLYDGRLSQSNARYAEIKRAVYDRLKENSKVSFPVVHPILDSPHGLGKLIRLERRIPVVNMACAFESTMPVLRLAHLRDAFADPASIAPGRFDVFSETISMQQLFRDDSRLDVRPLSIGAHRVLLLLTKFVPSFNLLAKGRRIDDSSL